jgi:uncharacterized protein (DUF1697 family)
MPAYALFLRGINVGGHMQVPMAGLRELIAGFGFSDVRTLLQSGNAVFRGPAQPAAALERRFEAAVAKRFDVPADCMVRTAREVATLLAENPFPSEARGDPGHLLVVILREAPRAKAVEALRAAIPGREAVALVGRQLWAVYPDGVGRSKLSLPLIERTLGTRGTGRNWNTMTKVAAALEA